ncbi:helix-turn-helix domain-containing protein [Devosia sp.]|uniref:helix-turn-helix domain-containing protein n=1 Tax=Devosia sp. TaxID=1871048 RepID=UPI003BA9C80C
MNELLPATARPALIECYGAEFRSGDPEAAAAYTKVLMAAFDFEIPAHASAEPFAASTELFFLPDVTVSWAKITASRFTRTMRTIAARGTDQILVVCYRNGHFDMTTGGETKRVEAGEIAFIDLSQAITIEAPLVDNISLAVSRRKLEAMVPFLDAAHGFVRPRDALSKLLYGMLEGIVAAGADLPVVDARGIAGAALQLVVACLEPLSRQSAESGRNTVSLVAIKAFIEQHLLEPTLGPQALLDTFGITRSTLYRLFEPLGGVSAYIAQRKLNHAFRLLSDTRQPRGRISQLATELGFSHPSAFTRAFKDAFGLSPKTVQALAEQSREQEVQLLISPEPMQYLKPLRTS